jgi:predicted HicB family RNase H-like nuclease
MKDMMEYQGYLGSVHYSDDDRTFYGKVAYIRSLVSYEGQDVESLKANFEEAVDDYLELCRERGIEPEQPFKGSFNIRPGTALHRRAAIAAQERGINLNRLVTEALEHYLNQTQHSSAS